METENMHYGADAFSFQLAESLRKTETFPETILWNTLKNKQFLGLKFRRQHAINRFVVDFYCHKYKLVIEVDGSVHDNEDVKIRDKERECELESYGLKIIRFSNKDITHNLQTVLIKTEQFVNENKITEEF